MSGIAGLLNFDGAPANPDLLRRMTEFLRFRGPDAQDSWIDGPAGFVHTLLRTTWEAEKERQPCTLEGERWITADCRIDDRAELIRGLEAAGRRDVRDCTDPELILHSYGAWGEACVERLIGDFSFAIWDRSVRTLFCARDQMGVKPFLYASGPDFFVFSNTLRCVALHPEVSDRLDDLAIADFLLFDFSQDPSASSFADIRRLPPAHTLSITNGQLRFRRYWTPPIEEPLRYRRRQDYIDRFLELFEKAVRDRLRTDRAGVFMSGGLDSPWAAAMAKRVLSADRSNFDLRAHTFVFDEIARDRERYYAGLAAAGIGIPIVYLVGDSYEPLAHWSRPDCWRPEPQAYVTPAMDVDQYNQIREYARVALTGFGADPLLLPAYPSATNLLRGASLMGAAGDLIWLGRAHKRIPPLGLRTVFRNLFRGQPAQWVPPYPEWLNPDWEKAFKLRERFAELNELGPPQHPYRPEAHRDILYPFWAYHFGGSDAGETGIALEVRHPFFDLRLIRYLLQLPSVPWCLEKSLLRTAAPGLLPDAIRVRRKTPFQGDPTLDYLKNQPPSWWEEKLQSGDILARYVDLKKVPTRTPSDGDSYLLSVNLRPLCLNLWISRGSCVTSSKGPKWKTSTRNLN